MRNVWGPLLNSERPQKPYRARTAHPQFELRRFLAHFATTFVHCARTRRVISESPPLLIIKRSSEIVARAGPHDTRKYRVALISANQTCPRHVCVVGCVVSPTRVCVSVDALCNGAVIGHSVTSVLSGWRCWTSYGRPWSLPSRALYQIVSAGVKDPQPHRRVGK